MCTHYVKIKNSSPTGVRYAYVPCGKCADCRRKAQEAWKFRLYSEFLTLKSKGWRVGFITLTYDEESLPSIPAECFKDQFQYRVIHCFDRQAVRDWINNIRHYCKYHYHFTNGNNIRYFVTSEYGSISSRPHYHAILAWPPSCSYEEMHALCKHYWTKGLVGPKTPQGDRSNLPFEVVGDASKALSYVCKYATKDIDYQDTVADLALYDNVKAYEEGTDERAYARMYRNCIPFHLQSVSLGMEAVKDMTEDERYRVLQDGMTFTCDGTVQKVPVYVKNKLVYDIYYIVDDDGKRLVRRKANSFFRAYRKEIFEAKAEYYEQRMSMMSGNYLQQCGVAADTVAIATTCLNEYRRRLEVQYPEVVGTHGMQGKLYLAYAKVASNACYDLPLEEQWFSRYLDPREVAQLAEDCEWQFADGYMLSWFRQYWDMIDMCYGLVGAVHLQDRENQERLTKRILDFYNNVL